MLISFFVKNAMRGGGEGRVSKGLILRALFVNLLRSPGIDSHPGRPVRQTYLSHRPARIHRLAKSIHHGIDSSESIPWLHKGLQIRALYKKEAPRRKITVTSSLIEISKDGLGK
jgi:hypothetical protein